MANSLHIRPFIKQFEGGLSRNPADNASVNPAPWVWKGLTGWHTNKGVTYTSFVSNAVKLGYAITPENFFLMPDSIWNGIFKESYWNPWGLDNMRSQAIADFIANAAWGSGLGGSLKTIKGYLAEKGVTVSTKSQAVSALNKLSQVNETKIFEELIDYRNNYLRTLSDFNEFGKGWLNRSSALLEFGLQTILKKKLNTALP